MTVLLAQATETIEAPAFEFSAFAPESLLVWAAMLLLLLAVAADRRIAVGSLLGVLTAAVGVWLLVRGLTVPGAVTVGFGAVVVASTIGFVGRPALLHVWIAGAAVAGALVLTAWQWAAIYAEVGAATYLSGAIALDGVALYTRVTVLVSALLVLPIGYGYLQDRHAYRLEFEPLLLLSVTGMTILGAAGDLLIVFVAIELLSFALYVLCGLARRDRRSQEASLKYFLLGAVTSAILVYGVALLYVATGTIDLAVLSQGLALVTTPEAVVFLGMAFVTVGLAFKVAAVPFHFWTPDVYQGAPTNVTAFMAAATKAAAFAALLRVFLLSFGRLDQSWIPVLGGVAVASMMLGAIAAVIQRDVKRVLAYSSIAHVGYALIGVTAASPMGLSATLYYLLTYAVTAVGSFGCVVAIERRRRGEVALVDLRGLGKQSPVLAGVFGLTLLSLAGIPATAGFAGKFAVFRAGLEADLGWIVVVGVVSSVIAGFFYLRLIAAMYLEEPDEGTEAPVLTTGLSAGIAAAAAAVVVLGILPDAFVTLADRAAAIAR